MDHIELPAAAVVAAKGARVGRSVRAERAGSTREAILSAAEQLFAERGVGAVSNRQVSEAAGQGNNAAVGYHFGSKAELVRAIVRKHHANTELLCREMLGRARGSSDPRDWVACLVRPVTDHLAGLGGVSWYARFSAQLVSDPAYRVLLADESLSSKTIQCIVSGLHGCLPDLSPELQRERNAMARLLIVHTCAEYERGFADGSVLGGVGWESVAGGLIDAITGLYLAPVVDRA